MAVIGREMFLHGPPPGWLRDLPEGLGGLVQEAEESLRESRARISLPGELEQAVTEEAEASSHIEGEYNPGMIRQHAGALGEFLRSPAGEPDLLRMHGAMMMGCPHAQPGRYRTVQVTIGSHRPPSPGLVTPLMEELFSSIRGQKPSAPMAVWAHVQFETVHPFADGNGRAGRALLQSVLGSPIPLSRFILRERPTYYGLFRRSDWPAWLEWFCRGITEEAGRRTA